MSEIDLRDAILRGALLLQLLSASKSAEADAILAKLAADLKLLLNSRTLSEAGKAEINALFKQADEAINPAYEELAATVDTHELALVVADRTVAALEDVLPVAISTPTTQRLASLTKDVMIHGAPSSAWWDKQAEDTSFKFAAAVRQGVVNGETNEQIVARIVAKRGSGESGILDVARGHARSLVQSSIMSAANDARLATFRKNARHIAGVRWLSTLDSHTCVQCAALDDQAWDLDGGKLSGTEIDFMAPPAHWSCRCVLSPIPKSLADFGITVPEGQRASAAGPVPSSTTFADFLKRQSPEFVDRVMGKRRAELYMSGRLTLTDLVSGSGRELTLEQI